MEHNYKKLVLLFFSLFTLSALISCGEDDEEKKNDYITQILGTWDMAPKENGDITEFVFNDDGNFISNIYIEGNIDDIFEGTYIIEKDIVTINFSVHKERVGTKWNELKMNDSRKFRFRIEKNKLTLYSLTTEDYVELIRKL